MVVALAVAASLFSQGPELPQLPPIRREAQITYVDRSGAVIGVRGGRFAPPVDVARLPGYVPAAFVAIEDHRFYEHEGVDPVGIARALVADVTKGRMAQGASTITQQLARDLFLSTDKTVERKATELVYAIQLERTYSKRQILGLYLSRANFGSGAWGIEAAAERYFGKPASRLTLREAAILAGVMKSPTHYDPATEPEAALDRSRLVLAAMLQSGAISQAQYSRALAERPHIYKTSPIDGAQYFVDWMDAQVRQMVPRVTQDLVVETTLDLPMEEAAEATARATLVRYKAARIEQAALVSVDGAGRVWALLGGIDHQSAPYNRAVDARRQAGSSWKPFVYLTAMEAGRTPDMMAVDEPVTINGWSPKNYEAGYEGPVTLEKALAHSINTVAARLADEIGRDNVAATARRLGISTEISTDPAMALGTSEVTPLQMAQAYAAFSNGGYQVRAWGLSRIKTATGQLLYQHTLTPQPGVIGNPALSELNRMLHAVVAYGTGTKAAIPGYDIAGKTGTTQDSQDAWFCGFTGDFTTVVWMGRDDNRPMRRITGGMAPAEMWRAYMVRALKRVPAKPIPPGPPPPAPPLDNTVIPASAPGAPANPAAPAPTAVAAPVVTPS
ncbi:MAG TPA: PBP1A family penicillin-binding protein [Phenylobacterium sp.]|uniref:transglycosylase domain-containing protein n=1 Tax=Phenylobacterium sp. TaxID=1871053 RepID=UPI002B9BBA2F|nr:PBP1A family penicillin-binding protein [Phenylobacterium sp.]HSV03346.1 PBP1A family penicillin-binding protein [Phenylobacterium sp.]